jgi:hypothetical protein
MQKSTSTSRYSWIQIAHSTYGSQSSNSMIFSFQVVTVHQAPLSRAYQRVSGRLALPSTRLSDVCIRMHEGESPKLSSAPIKGGDGTRGSPSDPFSCQYILITSFPVKPIVCWLAHSSPFYVVNRLRVSWSGKRMSVTGLVSRRFEDKLSRRSSIAVKLSKQGSVEAIKRHHTCGRCGNPCLLI